ncbi:hypothetical protein [Candidatus Aquiluna sp. UB-MaderosW2red]|uniref:hypothetical protein n=1 Tax=Candidatus Aquiluna sp. UB-MaderosW2red TaxID=1855377 RepID=UPI000875C928|nr:hypothetical protein [Candidatus Aquiluna sp. UB-MaderosW2red]SCX04335.1 hypothetical protein SAMN05216534_0245 [Candidatus Aquiluna sp. UB-MaderosW2red]
MALEIYGGDPRVVATREELFRIAMALRNSASELNAAIFSPPDMLLGFLPNPVPNIQLAISAPRICSELESLASNCDIVAENYFSTEARVSHIFQDLIDPLRLLTPVLSIQSPITNMFTDQVAPLVGAMAVVGLLAGPSIGSSSLLGGAIQLAPLMAARPTVQSFLAGGQLGVKSLGIPVDATGSATLLRTAVALPPRNLADLATRLHNSYSSPSSAIRIESYPLSSGKQFVVYVPGTQSLLLGGTNPLNIRSNFTAMGGVFEAPSEQAVKDAIAKAGAGSGDRVLLVGHSQGALIAGNIASSPQEFEVSGLVSFAGPIGHLKLDVPVIAIQHSADPVPLLSGRANPLTQNWVTASSSAEFEDLIAAHRLDGYIATATELDQSQDIGLNRVKNALWPDSKGSGTEYVYGVKRD